MADIKYINPGSPVAGPYTPGIIIGNFIFISGQAPTVGCENIKDQTTSELEKIKQIIEASGSNVLKIVKTTVYLSDINNYTKMNEAYKEFFDENGTGGNYPARTTVEVANLPLTGMLVEIEAIGVI